MTISFFLLLLIKHEAEIPGSLSSWDAQRINE